MPTIDLLKDQQGHWLAKPQEYFVVVRGSIVHRQYLRDAVWQNTPFRCTQWEKRDEADAVAAQHEGARVLRRTR